MPKFFDPPKPKLVITADDFAGFYGNHLVMIAVIFLLFGLWQAMFGLRFMFVSFYILVSFDIALIFALCIQEGGFFEAEARDSLLTRWPLFLSSVFVGLGLGILPGFIFYSKCAPWVFGMNVGAIASLCLFNLVVQYIFPSADKFALYILMAAIGFVSGLAFNFIRKPLEIPSSAIVGAYCMSRGLGWLIGGYPSELIAYHNLPTLDAEGMPPTWLAYLAAQIILTGGSFYAQSTFMRRIFMKKWEPKRDPTFYQNLGKGSDKDADERVPLQRNDTARLNYS